MAARCCGAGSGQAWRLRPGSGDADREAAWTAPAGLVKHELTASNEQINKTFAVNTRDNFLPLIRPRVALPAKWGCAPSADGGLGGGHPGRGHPGSVLPPGSSRPRSASLTQYLSAVPSSLCQTAGLSGRGTGRASL